MGRKDPRVDAYIEKAAPFAKPILERVRTLVHRACPDVQETIKWSFPHFEYEGILCGMSAFKAHCAFGFWKRQLIFGSGKAEGAEPMNWSRQIRTLSDLPPEREMLSYIRKAAELNKSGTKLPTRPKAKKPLPKVPRDFAAALNRNPRAKKAFENFSPSHKREYVEWIVSAKRDETRHRRLNTALQWLSEGKPHNWRYMK